MKKVWAILIWGVLVFGIGTYLDKVREMLMMGGDPVVTYVTRFGVGLALAVFVVLVGRWVKRWLSRDRLGRYRLGSGRLSPGDWCMIGAVAWGIEGGYNWWMEPGHTVDIQIHETVYVIAEVHVVGGMVLLYGLMGAIYYLGRGMNRVLGYIHFFLTHAALYLLFWMKNFDPAYSVKGYLAWREFQNYKMVSGGYEVMAALFLAAQLLFAVNLFLMLRPRSHRVSKPGRGRKGKADE